MGRPIPGTALRRATLLIFGSGCYAPLPERARPRARAHARVWRPRPTGMAQSEFLRRNSFSGLDFWPSWGILIRGEGGAFGAFARSAYRASNRPSHLDSDPRRVSARQRRP